MRITLGVAVLSALTVVASASSAAAPTSGAVCPAPVAEVPPASASAGGSGGGNPVVQLGTYVKDQVVRMKDGSLQLWTNHKTCNAIRLKQKAFAHENGELRKPNTGGITYDEFVFLQKGKDDRGRVANLGFMMFFAPNFLPYAIMFNKNMLPSTFQMEGGGGGGKMAGHGEVKWQSISRERSHAVIRATLDLEDAARVPSQIANMNPFGKGKARKAMDRLGDMAETGVKMLRASGGVDSVMNVMEPLVFTADKPAKARAQLADVPKSIMMGLARSLEAGKSPPSYFYPNFLVRGQVLNHIKKMTDADEFLVDQSVDLSTLNQEALAEACAERLIGCGGPFRSEDEMREGLRTWLDAAVVRPRAKVAASVVAATAAAAATTDSEGEEGGDEDAAPAAALPAPGLHYNANLARTALLCYHAADATRDGASASVLPRALFGGQKKARMLSGGAVYDDEGKKSKGKRRWGSTWGN